MISKKDVKVDIFRSDGAKQIRLTHIPTGLSIQSDYFEFSKEWLIKHLSQKVSNATCKK